MAKQRKLLAVSPCRHKQPSTHFFGPVLRMASTTLLRSFTRMDVSIVQQLSMLCLVVSVASRVGYSDACVCEISATQKMRSRI